jgi:hypothetical protein
VGILSTGYHVLDADGKVASQMLHVQLAYRDEVLTQELKCVLDACISSSGSMSGGRDLESSTSQVEDGCRSIFGAQSVGSEWDCVTEQSGLQSHARHQSGTSKSSQ